MFSFAIFYIRLSFDELPAYLLDFIFFLYIFFYLLIIFRDMAVFFSHLLYSGFFNMVNFIIVASVYKSRLVSRGSTLAVAMHGDPWMWLLHFNKGDGPRWKLHYSVSICR